MTQIDYLTVSVGQEFWHSLSWAFHSGSHKAVIRLSSRCQLGSWGPFSAPRCHTQVLAISTGPSLMGSSQQDCLLLQGHQGISGFISPFRKAPVSLLRVHLIRPSPPRIISLSINSESSDYYPIHRSKIPSYSQVVTHPQEEGVTQGTYTRGWNLGVHLCIVYHTYQKMTRTISFHLIGAASQA